MKYTLIKFKDEYGKQREAGPLPHFDKGTKNSFNIGKQLKHIYESGCEKIACHLVEK